MAKSTHFAGHTEPLQIYEDADFYHQPAHSLSRAAMPSMGKQHHSPLQNSHGNILFSPPPVSGYGSHTSPFKPVGRPMASPLTQLKSSTTNAMMNPVSLFPPAACGHMSTDSMQKKQPTMSRFKTMGQRQMSDNANMAFGKENMHPILFPAPTALDLDLGNIYQKPMGKRALLEAASAKDAGLQLQQSPQVDAAALPPHDSFPAIIDDGQKPSHSYAQLIGMAILRTPNRRLTLSQIYKWISDTYSFYKANDAGWQNSIRHNLSLNKAFIKQERPKDDPGKGNYWAIEPGLEGQFMKEKPARRTLSSSVENVPVMSTRLEPARIEPYVYQDSLPTLPPVLPAQSIVDSQLPAPEITSVPEALEVSSDATIPLSDNATPDEATDKVVQEVDNAADENQYSPLPTGVTLHSSPPIPRHMEPRSNTPPPFIRAPASSGVRTHKRKFASMDSGRDDSGYISSLESSVMRPNQGNRYLPSEGDRPRHKKGRAEEEIARIRGSSYDSPTKARSYGYVPPSSSPVRQDNGSRQMPPPLTPVVKMKAPPKPPPSVSPNTNLRLHRDKVNHMLNSPLRRVSRFGQNYIAESPVHNFEESFFNMDGFPHNSLPEFDIFQDSNFGSFFDSANTGSPVKRSAKRSRMDRAHSTSILGDITNSASNRSITSAPLLKPANQTLPTTYDTPSKVFEDMPSPTRALLQSPMAFKSAMSAKANGNWSVDDLYSVDLFEEGENVDILQGFERIGGNLTNGSAKPSKPVLGRSYTTDF